MSSHIREGKVVTTAPSYQTYDDFSIVHIETFDDRTRHQVVQIAAKAADSVDGCHVYRTPRVDMQATGRDSGEMDTWISIHTPDGLSTFDNQIAAIRAEGLRVKFAMHGVPYPIATGTARDMFKWLDEELKHRFNM